MTKASKNKNKISSVCKVNKATKKQKTKTHGPRPNQKGGGELLRKLLEKVGFEVCLE
jgi:hypothetical protein